MRQRPEMPAEPDVNCALALSLSEEYAMRHWIEALLDPAPIEKGSKDKVNTHIQQPPVFDLENATLAALPLHSALRTSTRARSTRSASPSKMATPSRKIATPRKPRTTRGGLKSEVQKIEETIESSASKAASALQNVIANGADIDIDDSVASDSVSGEVKEVESKEGGVKDGVVHIEVQETVETEGNVETKSTNVSIDVPHSHAELPEPEDPAKMIAEARRMVEEAQKLEAGSSSDVIKSSKRKVEEIVEEGELEQDRPSKSARTVYTTEQKLVKEKVARRAMFGVFAMAAIGYGLNNPFPNYSTLTSPQYRIPVPRIITAFFLLQVLLNFGPQNLSIYPPSFPPFEFCPQIPCPIQFLSLISCSCWRSNGVFLAIRLTRNYKRGEELAGLGWAATRLGGEVMS